MRYVVSVFGSGGKLAVFLLWREIFITTGKKRYSRLSVGCAVLAITTRKKKDTVVCLAGCAVVSCQFLVLVGNWQFFCCGGEFLLRPEKKDTVICLAGARSLLQPEKKDTIVNIQFVLVQLELKLIQIR